MDAAVDAVKALATDASYVIGAVGLAVAVIIVGMALIVRRMY
jgi:hypothetical protein